MKKILPILLLVAGSYSRLFAYNIDSASSVNTISTPIANSSYKLRPSYGDGAASVNGFYSMMFGLSHGKSVVNDSVVKGSGGTAKIELGVKIAMRSPNGNSDAQMSVSIAVLGYRVAKNSFSYVSLPLSYTHYRYGRNGEERGSYWLAGLNLNYMFQADDTKKLADNPTFNRIMADPTVGCGIYVPFKLVNRRGGAEVGSGRLMLGLLSSYTAMDIRKGADTQRGFTIGVQWQYIFF